MDNLHYGINGYAKQIDNWVAAILEDGEHFCDVYGESKEDCVTSAEFVVNALNDASET